MCHFFSGSDLSGQIQGGDLYGDVIEEIAGLWGDDFDYLQSEHGLSEIRLFGYF